MTNELFHLQISHKNKIKQPSIKHRKTQLRNLEKWILSNRKNIQLSLHNDFKKPAEETDLSEIFPVLSEIRTCLKKINKWCKPQSINRTIPLILHNSYVQYEAKGVVLIISPWNYPFLLAIGPLVSAIAAGNSVIIKPSEISTYTSSLIEKMITEIFPKEEVAVIQGGKEISTELLELPFDHIFFTGSTEVGKIVAETAAKNFTSTTLELGGKSPTVVDDTANLSMAAEKIIWGKFLNKGQTCVAPDYILVDKNVTDEFSTQLKKNVEKIYSGENIQENNDYARIINDQHFERLVQSINDSNNKGAQIIFGGKTDNDDKFIEPTIVLANNPESILNTTEIFGPILPIIEYNKIEDAIKWINNRTHPLSIYIFSEDKNNISKIVKSTKSGAVGINEVVVQFGHKHLPFGGVKHSGSGRTHGYEGFKAFSNSRSFIKSGKINATSLIYPPFTKLKRTIIEFMLNWL